LTKFLINDIIDQMKKILIILLLLLVGCASPGNKRVDIKRPIDNRAKWKVLAPLVKKYFKTDMPVEWIAAELNLAEYELSRKE